MFSSNTSQVVATSTQAEAVDFDGTNDYLRKTSDLTGNTTSKTFTFSAWFWQGNANTSYFYVVSDGTNQRFVVRVVGNGTISVEGTANTNSVILSVTAPLANASRLNTFYHVLISMDMANAANRSIYINDVAQTLTVTTYTNTAIPFNQVDHVIAGTQGGSAGDQGRLSNVFLDYTYRDMSVTANRRLFVTADLKPAAGQAALNPILYLAMSDPTTVGTNTGTGGNFTLTGTVARSGRGPNQYNAPYSDFDGGNDYLSRTTAPTSIADGKQLTVSGVFNSDSTAGRILVFSQSTNYKVEFALVSGKLTIECKNAAGSTVLSVTANQTLTINRNYQFVLSCDMTDSAKRWLKINGEDLTNVWSTYVNDNINFSISSTPRYLVGATSAPAATFNGRLGALWFNTSYIDLSVASNLAKFVSGTGIDAKPVDLGATGELPTGTAPLIYLPMYGNNAGKNYGTGGDFTVNSGPYTGARGPNEFWGNKASGFNGSSDIYLTKATALSGVPTSGSTLSIVCWFNLTNYTSNRTIFGTNSAGTMTLQVTSGGNLFMWLDSSGYVQFSQVVPTGSWVCLMFSKTGSTYTVYVNDTVHTVDVANSFNRGNSVTYTNTPVNIATRYSGSTTGEKWYGSLSEFYFTTEYIDFSQEANRLKFRDAFGNPTDLPSAITAASVPTPAIYMRFPPTSFGTNSGTGGNFTVTGTITDGGQL